ncbi:unnamed protein product [Protopolystoma xenopodis]|uniref:Uncharacterized protein n=1 Tax=Protopolystoma xenopodis TaxID=117903 RepID=A0A448WJ91_9PLAT|nr:unnamed protein product [Protopolystoma xenopodis]
MLRIQQIRASLRLFSNPFPNQYGRHLDDVSLLDNPNPLITAVVDIHTPVSGFEFMLRRACAEVISKYHSISEDSPLLTTDVQESDK